MPYKILKSQGNIINASPTYNSFGLSLYTDFPISLKATVYRTLNPPLIYSKAKFATNTLSYYPIILKKKLGGLSAASSSFFYVIDDV